jgi:hypothetical protein
MIFAFGVVENNLFGCVMMKAKPLRNYIKKKKKKKLNVLGESGRDVETISCSPQQ